MLFFAGVLSAIIVGFTIVFILCSLSVAVLTIHHMKRKRQLGKIHHLPVMGASHKVRALSFQDFSPTPERTYRDVIHVHFDSDTPPPPPHLLRTYFMDCLLLSMHDLHMHAVNGIISVVFVESVGELFFGFTQKRSTFSY